MGKPCEKHEYQYKFVLVGDSGVGKTRLFAELTGKEVDIGSKSTIGVEFGSKIIEQKDSTLKAQVTDFIQFNRGKFWGLKGTLQSPRTYWNFSIITLNKSDIF